MKWYSRQRLVYSRVCSVHTVCFIHSEISITLMEASIWSQCISEFPSGKRSPLFCCIVLGCLFACGVKL